MAESFYHAAVIGLLGFCAWTDITTFKIRNNAVLALLSVVILFWLTGLRELGWTDVILAGALFVIGLSLWFLRAIGGGDVKLLGTTMLALGSHMAMAFGLGLFVCAMLWLIFLRYWMVVDYYLPFPAHLRRAITARRVPYGVCIALAATGAILVSSVR